MDDLETLLELLVPPEEPVGTGTPGEWEELEARMGTALPSDYKAFVSTFGAGSIDKYFYVLNPFISLYGLEYEVGRQREAHLWVLEYDPQHPAGLIPWGMNDQRGNCFWETDAPDPDRWTVFTECDDDWHRFPEPMTTFLVKVLLGDHISSVFGSRPKPFDPLPAYYYPWFEGIPVRAVVEPATTPEAMLEVVRQVFAPVCLRGLPDFGIFAELQCLMTRRGWYARFRFAPGDHAAELRVHLPEEDLGRLKAGLVELAALLGGRVRGAWRGAEEPGPPRGPALWPDIVDP